MPERKGWLPNRTVPADHPRVHRTVTSRRRRLATGALLMLTIWSGTDLATWPGGISLIHLTGLFLGAWVATDPLRRIWPRRRITIADLPRLQGDLPRQLPIGAVPAEDRRT